MNHDDRADNDAHPVYQVTESRRLFRAEQRRHGDHAENAGHEGDEVRRVLGARGIERDGMQLEVQEESAERQ